MFALVLNFMNMNMNLSASEHTDKMQESRFDVCLLKTVHY